jgi:hypothetical protein
MQEVPIDIDSWVQETSTLWIKRGIKILPGVTIAIIESTEADLGFRFPSDMKDLYRVVNGFKDCDMDVSSMISIWPMERIREEYIASNDKNFIGFCDWLICSHSIGFFKGRMGIFKCYEELNAIAETFRQVIDMINNDSELLV